MRRFEDAQGGEWTVAASVGSFGAVTLMFAPAGDSRLWSQPLAVDNAAEAEAWLAAISEQELRERLANACPWAPTGDT